MLIDQVAAVQALVAGVVFAWAGIWKVFVPSARTLAAESALATMLGGPRRAQTAHLAVGVGELVVATLLLLPPSRWWAMPLATMLALGFVGYLGLAWRIAPEKPCGCLGGRASKISWRSAARAVALLGITLLGWPTHTHWAAALVAAPLLLLLVAAEAFVLWILSPEFGSAGARFQTEFIDSIQRRLDPDCSHTTLDWTNLERRLRGSVAFRQLLRYTPVGDRSDRWLEGCTAFITYGAVYDAQPATVVFSVPVRFDARDISAAVASAVDERVFFRLVSPRESARLRPEERAAALLVAEPKGTA